MNQYDKGLLIFVCILTVISLALVIYVPFMDKTKKSYVKGVIISGYVLTVILLALVIYLFFGKQAKFCVDEGDTYLIKDRTVVTENFQGKNDVQVNDFIVDGTFTSNEFNAKRVITKNDLSVSNSSIVTGRLYAPSPRAPSNSFKNITVNQLKIVAPVGSSGNSFKIYYGEKNRRRELVGQGDGNLVVYNVDDNKQHIQPQWATATNPH